MFAAAFGVDAAMHRGACRRQFRRRFQIVNYPAVLRIRNLGDLQALGPFEDEPSSVMDLTAAGGIERGLPQDDGRTRLLERRRCNGFDHRIEFVNFRTIVVKALGHNPGLAIKALRRWRAGRPRPAAILLDGRDARRSIGRLAKRANEEPGTGAPLHTKEPVTVASFRTWRGWRENVARNRCLTLHLSKRSPKTGMDPAFRCGLF